MNLSIFLNQQTSFMQSGTKEELQVAEFLKSQCEELGVPAHLEGFRVAMGDIEEVHLLADGQEIPCKALQLLRKRSGGRGALLYAGNGSGFPGWCKGQNRAVGSGALDFSATMI